jgi:AcrR family transcriptional regulator
MDPKVFREQAVKDAKCNLILVAAQRIFTEKGYMNARLEDIAAAAGFSKPTLYSYYEDKEAIFLSLAIREFQKVIEKINTVIRSKDSFLEALESVLRIILVNFIESFAYLITASSFNQNMNNVNMAMLKNNDLMMQFHDCMDRILVSIEDIIKHARSTGEIASKLGDKELSLFIVSLIQGVQMRSWMMGKVCDADLVIGQIIDFVKHGAGIRGHHKSKVSVC